MDMSANADQTPEPFKERWTRLLSIVPDRSSVPLSAVAFAV